MPEQLSPEDFFKKHTQYSVPPPMENSESVMTPEEAKKFETYGPFSGNDIKSLISDDRSFLEKKLPDEGLDKLGNTIGAMIHGGFDSASFGAGHRKLDDLAEALGGKRTFEARKKVFERTAPWSFAGGGMASALAIPGGSKAAEYIKEAPGILSKLSPQNLERLAKAAGLTVDALQSALYGYNSAEEGKRLEGAEQGAAISAGLSLGLPLVGKTLSKTGSKIMDWFFGLPPEIQNKIKSNPDILKNVASQEEIGDKLVNALNSVSKKGIESSKKAGEKLSSSLQDYITPEKLRGTIESIQEEMGPVKGLKLKESAFNRLEALKQLFPEENLMTPSNLKPILQDLRQEAFEKTTEGPTKDALKKVQYRLDQILKENPEYLNTMKETSFLTRLGEVGRKKLGIKEMQNLDTGATELLPSDLTSRLIRGNEKSGRGDRLMNLISKEAGSNLPEEIEKLRLSNFLSQPRSNQNTGARVLLPFLGSIAGASTGGIEGALLGGGTSAALDKYGRRVGGELLGETARMGKFLDENKLFKEVLSGSKANKKYAASHFIQSQVNPEYNKENSR